jgi:hypothetical protein
VGRIGAVFGEGRRFFCPSLRKDRPSIVAAAVRPGVRSSNTPCSHNPCRVGEAATLSEGTLGGIHRQALGTVIPGACQLLRGTPRRYAGAVLRVPLARGTWGGGHLAIPSSRNPPPLPHQERRTPASSFFGWKGGAVLVAASTASLGDGSVRRTRPPGRACGVAGHRRAGDQDAARRNGR